MEKIICVIEGLGSGGAERQMSYLATLLKQHKYDVSVYTYNEQDFYASTLLENHVPIKRITTHTNKIIKIYSLFKVLRKERPKVVITYLDPPSMAACIVKMFFDKFKLIVSERNTTQKLALREYFKFSLYKISDYIVPNSYSQANFISRKFPSLNNKVRVINNVVDTSKFSSKKIDVYNNTTLKLLIIARIMPQKNPLSLIEAVRLIRDKKLNIKVRWVGNQDDIEYFTKCLSLVKSYSIEDYIEFIPPTKDVVSELHHADALCLPSFYEGYPNVICEAMSCGLPILCSRVCDNMLIVKDEINGFLFDPNNVQDIALAIIKMINLTEDQRFLMGQKNREQIILKNSKESFIDKYIEIIK